MDACQLLITDNLNHSELIAFGKRVLCRRDRGRGCEPEPQVAVGLGRPRLRLMDASQLSPTTWNLLGKFLCLLVVVSCPCYGVVPSGHWLVLSVRECDRVREGGLLVCWRVNVCAGDREAVERDKV